ncbi:serine/threonine protein kinase [Parabacteroides distasonis]|nr:serine/threonine protein kinase [Parabacteroides distasonis]
MKTGNKIDEYEIIEYIGEGGMGTVFRVCKDGNYYALKTCRTDDEESILRFKREVRIMKSVHDSNIINVIDENLDAIPPYFIMPLCEQSLEDAVDGILTEEEKFDYSLQVCEGIQLLHNQKIIHRDIKPSNALLYKGIVKVADLGLGKFINRDSVCLTPTNDKTMGTYDYVAPEIYIDGKGRDADERSDIYSIGKLLYYVFSDGESPLFVNSSKVSADIFSIIGKCTKVMPNDRYQNVSEIINALNICKKTRMTALSLEDIVSKHKAGVNDVQFAEDIYQYLLTSQNDLGLLIQDLKVLKKDDFQLLLKHKQKEIGNIANLLLTTYKENNYYWIQFEDVDILVSYAHLLMKNTQILQEKQELLEFSIEISINYNRWMAMGIVVNMFADLSKDEIKAMAPFLVASKDSINQIQENVNKPLPDALKILIR